MSAKRISRGRQVSILGEGGITVLFACAGTLHVERAIHGVGSTMRNVFHAELQNNDAEVAGGVVEMSNSDSASGFEMVCDLPMHHGGVRHHVGFFHRCRVMRVLPIRAIPVCQPICVQFMRNNPFDCDCGESPGVQRQWQLFLAVAQTSPLSYGGHSCEQVRTPTLHVSL